MGTGAWQRLLLNSAAVCPRRQEVGLKTRPFPVVPGPGAEGGLPQQSLGWRKPPWTGHQGWNLSPVGRNQRRLRVSADATSLPLPFSQNMTRGKSLKEEPGASLCLFLPGELTRPFICPLLFSPKSTAALAPQPKDEIPDASTSNPDKYALTQTDASA